MIIDQCPHCLVRHVQTASAFEQVLSAQDSNLLWTIVRCQNSGCQSLILIQRTNTGSIQQIFPFATYALDSTADISIEIRADFEEAGKCLGAGCFKASLVMSRRVLQRCLKAQGCDDHNLVDAIANSIENNLLRKAFHPLAEEIRQYGNLGAHPDDDQLKNANKANAEQVLEFARLLIHEFYEVPAMANLLKRNRGSK